LTQFQQTVWDWPATYNDSMVMIAPDDWRLEIGGNIERPRILTLQELKTFPQVTQNRRMVSAEGWSYRTEWMGVPLHHVVEAAKASPEATLIKQVNLSGHEEYLPVQDALKSRALLCFGVSNKMLPCLYGGPLRLMVFDRYSYKGLAQLSRIEFISPEEAGSSFWEKKGYSKEGNIQPGRYYAFDLKRARPIPQPGEVTIY
ncbi:MAG: molybdopterin-dependent oxidoreductase, partial [Cyanobacteria bacterium]|nr:molybdopterin-dependent oxidoreductase [Cyanobacteriota bacterium]